MAWPDSITPKRALEPQWLYGLRYRWWLRTWTPDPPTDTRRTEEDVPPDPRRYEDTP